MKIYLKSNIGLRFAPTYNVLASPLNEIIFVVAAQPDVLIILTAGGKPWTLCETLN